MCNETRNLTAAFVGAGDDRTVWLPAATRMSVGLRRPQGNMTISSDGAATPKAVFLQLVSTAADTLLGSVADKAGGTDGSWQVAAYLATKCSGAADLTNLVNREAALRDRRCRLMPQRVPAGAAVGTGGHERVVPPDHLRVFADTPPDTSGTL